MAFGFTWKAAFALAKGQKLEGSPLAFPTAYI